jgi:hypothetical protein
MIKEGGKKRFLRCAQDDRVLMNALVAGSSGERENLKTQRARRRAAESAERPSNPKQGGWPVRAGCFHSEVEYTSGKLVNLSREKVRYGS